jgi:Na+-translocating ferredoxin:NAD+ oxidoreductase RnfD subunit
LLGGLFILWRQTRWHIALSFLAAYAVGSALFLLPGGIITAAGAVPSLLVNATVIFFASVMVIEPITSNFSTRRQRMIYGALAGLAAAAIFFAGSVVLGLRLDPLVTGLLLADLIACLIFLPAKIKPATNASPINAI